MFNQLLEDLNQIAMWQGYKAVSDSIFDKVSRLSDKAGRWERITDKELEWVRLTMEIVKNANDI